MSEQIGKSNTTVSKHINQKVQPDLKTLNVIAKVLNVNVMDLLNDNILQTYVHSLWLMFFYNKIGCPVNRSKFR